MSASITNERTLSPSAKEVTLTLPQPLGFISGAFVNVFLEYDGARHRRAYSISSSDEHQKEITLSIRKGNPNGMSAKFWEENVRDIPMTIMGPLGLNTIDTIAHKRVFLIGFGIGVSVIKSLLEHLLADASIREMVVLTGSRTEEEILYKELFESIAQKDARVHVRFVVSQPHDIHYAYRGHIQEYISDFTFDDATVYLCGQGSACNATKTEIEKSKPQNVQFLVESFD